MPQRKSSNARQGGVLFFTGLLALGSGSLAAQSPPKAAVDAIFAEYDSTQTPGCALGVYQDGETRYARGYGMANLEYHLAIAPDSVFRLASVSKQFVAIAIALLDEAGELDLDDPVQKYFPAIPDYGTPITLRHLIHHTSGIRDYLELTWLADWGEWYRPEEALRLIERQQALNFTPGSDYLYSNSGYLMLADVVHQVTGQTLREWTSEHMLQPLGMHDSHFQDDHTQLVPRRADGYAPQGDGWRISMTQLDMVGDGGLYSTVQDLQRWQANFTNNRLGKGRQQLIELAETPAELSNGESSGYGFGLGVNEFRGTREIEHGGSWVGFRTALHRYPETDLSVAVLCNRSDAQPTSLAREVAALYLPANDAPVARDDSRTATAGDLPATVTLDETVLAQHVGSYWNAQDLNRRHVSLEDGQLIYDRDGWGQSPLLPVAEDRFVMADTDGKVLVSFADGELTVQDSGETIARLQRYASPAIEAAGLEAFAGNYYSRELDHLQHFYIEDGQLHARRRQGNPVLEPLFDDHFIADGLVLIFERDGQGRVTGFKANSNRMRNLAYTRRSGAAGE